MNKIKIIKISIFSLFGLLIFIVVIPFILIRIDLSNSYKKTGISFSSYDTIINKQEFTNLKIDKSYQNGQNSILSIFNYQDDYKLAIWRLNEYNDVHKSNVQIQENIKIEQEDIVTYVNLVTQDKPYISFTSKSNIPKTKNIYLKISNNSSFKLSKTENNYLMFDLELSMISFGNTMESSDILIYPLEDRIRTSCMIYADGNTFYVVMLYPLQGEQVDMDMLYHIFAPLLEEPLS